MPKKVSTDQDKVEKERYFKRFIDTDDEPSGRYKNKKPRAAACKAFTSLIREVRKTLKDDGKSQKDIENHIIGRKFNFGIVECTRGSKCKMYYYTGIRQRVKKNKINVPKLRRNKAGKIIDCDGAEFDNDIFDKNNNLLDETGKSYTKDDLFIDDEGNVYEKSTCKFKKNGTLKNKSKANIIYERLYKIITYRYENIVRKDSSRCSNKRKKKKDQ